MKVVLYHKNCQDGFFSALAAWEKFKYEALYIPIDYKPIQDMEPLEALLYIKNIDLDLYLDKGNSVYKIEDFNPDNYKKIDLFVVDYSFPISHFEYHSQVFNTVTVLDHHKTAVESYTKAYEYTENNRGWKIIDKENSIAVFSEKESGAKLTYQFLNCTDIVPSYIELINDRDLWKFDLKYTRAFHYGIKLLNFKNFNTLEENITYGLNRILDIGKLYEEDVTDRINKVKRSGTISVDVIIKGTTYSCGFVNSYPDIASDLCSSIIKDGYSIAVCYNIKESGQVAFSIRSKSGVDSSVISTYFGGGGHANASGCTCSLDVLHNILTTRTLEIRGNND